jgi:hypothetical protein
MGIIAGLTWNAFVRGIGALALLSTYYRTMSPKPSFLRYVRYSAAASAYLDSGYEGLGGIVPLMVVGG